jgi:release factor glutamine methyltransferase
MAVPDVRVFACDVDPVAVACARDNLIAVKALVVQGDIDSGLPEDLRHSADVVVANVPYVPTHDVEFLPAEARLHEPVVSLDGGDDGLAVLRRVAPRAASWLRDGGWFFTECSLEQAEAAAAVVRDAGLEPLVHNDDDLEVAVVSGQR